MMKWESWIQLYLKLTLGLSITRAIRVPYGGLQFYGAPVSHNQEFCLAHGFMVRAARLPTQAWQSEE